MPGKMPPLGAGRSEREAESRRSVMPLPACAGKSAATALRSDTFVTLSGMGSPHVPSSDRHSDQAGEVRAEALGVVSDALQWQLAAARWQAIEPMLAAMAAAVEAGDLKALAAATADLELAAPLRITRIGATPIVPPPPATCDRLNQLVHVLGGVVVSDRDANRSGSDHDDASRN
jgi:hypothetical protein